MNSGGFPQPAAAPSAVSERAWQTYLAELERIRGIIYAHPYAGSAAGMGGAHYLFQQIQAAAFNIAFGPDHHSPRFFANLLFDPGVLSWTSPGADYLYRKAFVDGGRSYRITGTRRNSTMLLIQVMAAYWNDPPELMKNIGNYDVDEFALEADGSFEIIASEKPHEGNWIRLDPAFRNICIMSREVFDDWEAEQASDLYIESIETGGSAHALTEDDYARRLEGMVRFMDYTIGNFSQSLVQDTADRGGCNRFVSSSLTDKLKDTGVNPLAGFDMMKFDLGAGEALLIEILSIDARQWTLQTSDLWHQCRNYADHQSSLNGFQARPDTDGVIRIVLSVEDPGIANWLDPAGLASGSIDFRFLVARSAPVVRCTLVRLDELGTHLPEQTVTVTSEERKASLRARRRAAMRRWGY